MERATRSGHRSMTNLLIRALLRLATVRDPPHHEDIVAVGAAGSELVNPAMSGR